MSTLVATLTPETINQRVMLSNSFSKEEMALYGSAIKTARKEKRETFAKKSLSEVALMVNALPPGTILKDVRITQTSKSQNYTVKLSLPFGDSKASIEAKLAKLKAEVAAQSEKLAKLNAPEAK